MLLFFSIDLFEGHVGMPIYSRQFIKYYKNPAIILNIRSKQTNEEKITKEQIDNKIIYHLDVNNFGILNFHPIIRTTLEKILFAEKDIKLLIYPDFIFAPYINFKYCESNNIKTMLIIHLLYRSYLNNIIENKALLLMDDMNLAIRGSWLENQLIEKTDYLICNSHYTKRVLYKYYDKNILSTKIIHTIPLGADIDKMIYSPQLENNNVCYFGRLSPQKGVTYLIADVLNNQEYYQQNPIYVYSSQGYKEYVTRMIELSYYEHGIKYIGHQTHEQILEELKKYKYCIFPSIYESYCIGLNEAMAMGKICIINSQFDSGMLDQLNDEYQCAIKLDFSKQSLAQFLQQNANTDWTHVAENAHKYSNNIKNHFEEFTKILTTN